jgi:peptidoglycan/LPS O-acetylase OafA/YrhL
MVCVTRRAAVFANLDRAVRARQLALMTTDFSYGLYLSAWPIQQTIEHFVLSKGIALHPLIMFAASIGVSLLAVAASWHLLERYAIRPSHIFTGLDQRPVADSHIRRRVI